MMSRTSKNSLRLTQKPGGLFDTCGTGEVDTLSPSADTTEINFSTLEASSIFDLLEKGSTGLEGFPDIPTPDIGLLEDCSYLDKFTDLSNLMNKEMVELEPLTSELVLPSAGKKTAKRRAEEAFVSAEASPTHHDHDGYASKCKKPRPSTSSYFSDDSEVFEDDDMNQKKSKKYLERRRKNNIASRRSRQTRKEKFSYKEDQVGELTKANEELRNRMAELEKATKLMKEVLIQKMSNSK